MNWSKATKKVLRSALRAWADMDIPYVAPKKTSALPMVLGAFGVAALGGICAVMVMSPRTRERAIDAAKGGYDKLLAQTSIFGQGDEDAASHDEMPASSPHVNGLAGDSEHASARS